MSDVLLRIQGALLNGANALFGCTARPTTRLLDAGCTNTTSAHALAEYAARETGIDAPHVHYNKNLTFSGLAKQIAQEL